MSNQPYVLGINQAELDRLGYQHRFWASATQALWSRAGLVPGARVLDAGCGPGFTSLDLAQLVGPRGRVDALDAAEMYLASLAEQAKSRALPIVTHQGDVEALAFPEETFDFVYVRWVLCFVAHPERVIQGAARVLRRGGVLVVQDYLDYGVFSLAPASPIFERVVAAIMESFRMRGGDPDIIRRLPALMSAHGLALEHAEPHLLAGRPGSLTWEWPARFFENFVPELVAKGLLTSAERSAFDAELAARSSDPSTLLFTPPLVDLIARKPR